MASRSDLAPITCGARLCPDARLLRLLAAYGEEYGRAVREVYVRCVIGGEDWFVKGGGGVRSELIARGWSQREATSIHKSAKAAQDAAVESTKLALERAREELEEVQERLAWARRSPKRADGRHGLARRRDRLRAQVRRLERRLADELVRVCFGSRRRLRATREWEANGYASRDEARAAWRRHRAGMVFVEGDREATLGNASLRVVLDDDEGGRDVLRMRVPIFLRGLSDGQEWVEVPARGFPAKQGREELQAAVARDDHAHQERVVAWRHAKARQDAWKELAEAGEHGPAPRPVAKTPPRRSCGAPVSVRLTWREDKQAWYVAASVPRPAKNPRAGRWVGVVGVDVNPDHLAWALVDRDGNPVGRHTGRIDLNLNGSSHQVADRVGVAVRDLLRQVKKLEGELDGRVAVAYERLDFTRARAGLRYLPARLARTLSSFAYNQILTTLRHRCAREGVTCRQVNPAWTSVLGQANYAVPYGLSVDQAAGVVIARRALGLSTRLRPSVLERLHEGGARSRARDAGRRHPHDLRVVAKRLGKRPATWAPGGLARRARVPQPVPQDRGRLGSCSPVGNQSHPGLADHARGRSTVTGHPPRRRASTQRDRQAPPRAPTTANN